MGRLYFPSFLISAKLGIHSIQLVVDLSPMFPFPAGALFQSMDSHLTEKDPSSQDFSHFHEVMVSIRLSFFY